MERIINAIETIEANTARMFGLEDERTQIVFMFTDNLRTVFENERAVENIPEASPAAEYKTVCFDDLLNMNEEETEQAIENLSEEQQVAFIREGLGRLIEQMFD